MPRKSKPIVISFSGIDGAGKSTQIAALRSSLERLGLSVRVITFWDEVARLTRLREVSGHKLFKGDKGVGSPETPINRRDKNVRSWPMSMLRLGLYFLDTLSLRGVVRGASRSGHQVIICDRYAYDELANLNLANPLHRLYARCMMRIAPRPDVSYFLDADPEMARARKPEYPVDFLHLSRNSYLKLSRLAGNITVIAPASIAEAQQRIWQAAEGCITSRQRPQGADRRQIA